MTKSESTMSVKSYILILSLAVNGIVLFNVAVRDSGIGEKDDKAKTLQQKLFSYFGSSNATSTSNAPDILTTTTVYKCTAPRAPVTEWSYLYFDKHLGAKDYGCNIAQLLDWVLGLREKEKKVYSQNGEDGVLEAIFERFGEGTKFFVEFGVQDARECNTHYLRDKGWKGVMFDNDHKNEAIGLYQESVWIDNVVQLFQKRSVPIHFDLLSVDTNFNDFWNLREIMLAGYKPRIVVVEVNVAPGPYASFAIPRKYSEDHGMFPGCRFFGASVAAYTKLMRVFGYQLLHVEKAVINAFYIKSSEIDNIDLAQVLWLRQQFLGLDGRNAHGPDPKNRAYVHVCEKPPCRSSLDW